jgi:hypothetical protein
MLDCGGRWGQLRSAVELSATHNAQTRETTLGFAQVLDVSSGYRRERVSWVPVRKHTQHSTHTRAHRHTRTHAHKHTHKHKRTHCGSKPTSSQSVPTVQFRQSRSLRSAAAVICGCRYTVHCRAHAVLKCWVMLGQCNTTELESRTRENRVGQSLRS